MKKVALIILSVVVIIASIVASGCSGGTTSPSAAAPPSTSSTAPQSPVATTHPGQVLKVGIITPSSGPAAEKGAPMGDGSLDAIQYINTELGGVDGYQIQADWYDSAYNAANVVTEINKIITDGDLLFTTASSFEMSQAQTIANRAGIPGLAVYTAASLYTPPEHIYGQTPDYGANALAFAEYYLKNIWKGSGEPKLAIEGLNNTVGADADAAMKANASKMGIDYIGYWQHTATTTSEIDALTKIKALNPDVLYISSTPAPTAVIIKNAIQLGMYPGAGMTIGVGSASFTSALITLGGASNVEGVYGVSPTVSWGDNVPGMAKLVEYAQKLHPKDVGNTDYIASWANSMIVYQALKNALNTVGYDKLAKGDASSWQLVETDGIQKLNYDVGGLQGPVVYTPGNNSLDSAMKVYQIQNGTITSVSGWVSAP